jgi:hypothetical protein
MAVLIRFLKEWNGHSPTNSIHQYIDELQAQILIRDGIAETIDGSVPDVPHN